MEITKEYLEKKLDEYMKAAEQHRLDSIANAGAADAIRLIMADQDKKPKG